MPHPKPVAIDEPDPTLAIPRLREIVRRLRAPNGCPWDIEQTHESLIPNLLEEAYEAADAIRSGDRSHMCEELGDLMLQAVMHAQIADEADDFNLDDVATGIADKLVRRHPHVFGDSDADNTEAVLAQWDEIKKSEKAASGKDEKSPSALDGVPTNMPAIMRANELQKKAAKVGFDWPTPEEVLPKVHEELQEVTEAIKADDQTHTATEIGDLLFTVINLSRKLKIDPEEALTSANQKFTNRFKKVESQLDDIKKATPEEMETAWNKIKTQEQHP